MLWQDFVFLVGSALSIVFLAPTLRDSGARVPLGTSLPSMGIGGAYAFTFASLEMTFSAAGALVAAAMWSLIAACRSPTGRSAQQRFRIGCALFLDDGTRWWHRRRADRPVADQFVTLESGSTAR